MTQRFIFLQDHRLLLQRANIRWEDCEYGAPSIDCKRPYGNSDVEYDIAEILGWKVNDELTPEQRKRAAKLHDETQFALEILIQTGRYPDYNYAIFERELYGDWHEVEDVGQ